MKKYIGLLIITIALISTFAFSLVSNTKIVGASGQTITPWVSYASSTSVLVGNTSTFVSATNTARVYERLSNLSGQTIYCNMQNGAPALSYKGLTIFASSTYQILTDEDPYRGAIYCIAPNGNATTTVLEQ